MATEPAKGYLRLVPGDVNGFLGLVVDNLSVLALLAAVLIGGYGVPAAIVFGRMFPGTALGVLAGDLAYTWLAVQLARRTGRNDVTAMPFGLDTPSTIGMALLVLGPAFLKFRAAGQTPDAAGLETWYLGMAATATMGLLKFPMAFAGRWLRRLVPQAGLLGSLAGIALMLIGFFPMVELLQVPIVGFLTLGLVLYALVAKGAVPGALPGVLFAVISGTLVYYGLAHWGVAGMSIAAPAMPTLRLALPHFDIGILHGFAGVADILPLIIPFALLTVVGGVNNTESAGVAGDDYDVRSILLAEAAATLVAGLAGGVAQTTPYIGHPAYKQMGARAGIRGSRGLHRCRRDARLPVQFDRADSLGGAGARAGVLVFEYHRTGIQRGALAARSRGGDQFFSFDRAPADHRAQRSEIHRAGALHAIAECLWAWLARIGGDRRAGQWVHHHRDDMGSIRR